MDESEDDGGSFELRSRIIVLMADLCKGPSSRLKFLVLSRYTADINKALHKYWKTSRQLNHLVLERENSGDIETLVENGLSGLRHAISMYESDTENDDEDGDGIMFDAGTSNTFNFPISRTDTGHSLQESLVFSRIRNYLIANSDGVILWVKLAIQTFMARVRRGFYKLEDLEADMKSLPKEIIDFYKLTIADLEARYPPEELQRTRTALMWVVGASAIRSLALGELYEALCVPTATAESNQTRCNLDPIANSPTRIHAKSWLAFYRQLRVRCGPLLEVIIPPSRETGSSFRKDTEINPHFTIQLLHRTVKDFLMSADESGSLAFTQNDADNLVWQTMHTYLDLALPKDAVGYCPVPASEDHDMFGAPNVVPAMVEYLENKNLLEFVLTAVPEDDLLPHLMIFERSFFPPLMEIAGTDWDQMLQEVSFSYFYYACHRGLARAMTNLLSMASVLLVSWPTLLRYGALATALKRCSSQFRNAAVSTDGPAVQPADAAPHQILSDRAPRPGRPTARR
ncbi:uncharacterized protein B0I36DRAFT_42423 [Microdochium trichocladiopsis]|uniref:DUF7791 domain-containing protein n=1 Tax=Microdochium trichocladiopsis TaxID=1682393 RepID=A0A9P9BIV9_9PEZI|nr:uncharacterized protein B0I36DRAFT_42423 [Microdochium trichocladiopsis]KAH7016088.1 hypothetical protein B0I36DRAFT_42423 [Microdochium trichocladiopsis]